MFVVTLCSLVAACGANVEATLDDSGHPIDGSSATDGAASGIDGAVGASSDLPCQVRDFLASHCISCHGASPVAGPPSLNSWAALTAQSTRQPGQTQAQRSLG
jgi:hypothetical protein